MNSQPPKKTINIHQVYYTALCYHQGNGIPKDEKKAFYLYRVAAEHGHVEALRKLKTYALMRHSEAMYHFAVMLENDHRGFPKSREDAFNFYRLAAEKNHAGALEKLKKSASIKDPEALYQLGLMLKKGQGIPKNQKKAICFFGQAVNAKHKGAFHALVECGELKMMKLFNELFQKYPCIKRLIKVSLADLVTEDFFDSDLIYEDLNYLGTLLERKKITEVNIWKALTPLAHLSQTQEFIESINQFIEKVPKSSSEKIASQKTQTQTQESKALKFFDWNKALKVAAKEIWDAISEDEQIKKKEQEVKDLEELKAFKSTYRRKF